MKLSVTISGFWILIIGLLSVPMPIETSDDIIKDLYSIIGDTDPVYDKALPWMHVFNISIPCRNDIYDTKIVQVFSSQMGSLKKLIEAYSLEYVKSKINNTYTIPDANDRDRIKQMLILAGKMVSMLEDRFVEMSNLFKNMMVKLSTLDGVMESNLCGPLSILGDDPHSWVQTLDDIDKLRNWDYTTNGTFGFRKKRDTDGHVHNYYGNNYAFHSNHHYGSDRGNVLQDSNHHWDSNDNGSINMENSRASVDEITTSTTSVPSTTTYNNLFNRFNIPPFTTKHTPTVQSIPINDSPLLRPTTTTRRPSYIHSDNDITLEDLYNLSPRNTRQLQEGLLSHLCHDAIQQYDECYRYSLEVFENFKDQLLAFVKNEIRSRHVRTKRGLFDFVGKVNKYLFGSLDADDGKRLDKALLLAQTSFKDDRNEIGILHDELASVSEVTASAIHNITGDLEGAIRDLSIRSINLEKNLQDKIAAISSSVTALQVISDIHGISFMAAERLEEITSVIRQLKQSEYELDEVLMMIRDGKLSPKLIPYFEVHSALETINKSLSVEFVIAPTFRVLQWYRTPASSISARGNSLLISLDIPIIRSSAVWSAKVVRALPFPMGDMFFQLKYANQVILHIPHSNRIAVITLADYHDCMTDTNRICKRNFVTESLDTNPCVRSLLSDIIGASKNCPLRQVEPNDVSDVSGLQVDDNRWMIVTKSSNTRGTWSCNLTKNRTETRQVQVGMVNDLKADGNCVLDIKGHRFVYKSSKPTVSMSRINLTMSGLQTWAAFANTTNDDIVRLDDNFVKTQQEIKRKLVSPLHTEEEDMTVMISDSHVTLEQLSEKIATQKILYHTRSEMREAIMAQKIDAIEDSYNTPFYIRLLVWALESVEIICLLMLAFWIIKLNHQLRGLERFGGGLLMTERMVPTVSAIGGRFSPLNAHDTEGKTGLEKSTLPPHIETNTTELVTSMFNKISHHWDTIEWGHMIIMSIVMVLTMYVMHLQSNCHLRRAITQFLYTVGFYPKNRKFKHCRGENQIIIYLAIKYHSFFSSSTIDMIAGVQVATIPGRASYWTSKKPDSPRNLITNMKFSFIRGVITCDLDWTNFCLIPRDGSEFETCQAMPSTLSVSDSDLRDQSEETIPWWYRTPQIMNITKIEILGSGEVNVLYTYIDE